jgi:hypothetical protein
MVVNSLTKCLSILASDYCSPQCNNVERQQRGITSTAPTLLDLNFLDPSNEFGSGAELKRRPESTCVQVNSDGKY